MTIINKIDKSVQSQSHRRRNWLGDGWAEVPPHMEHSVLECAPYCELVFNGDRLVGVIPTGRPQEPVQPDPMADVTEMQVDHEYRITLLELGVTSDAV